jgi:hypothetical protein
MDGISGYDAFTFPLFSVPYIIDRFDEWMAYLDMMPSPFLYFQYRTLLIGLIDGWNVRIWSLHLSFTSSTVHY